MDDSSMLAVRRLGTGATGFPACAGSEDAAGCLERPACAATWPETDSGGHRLARSARAPLRGADRIALPTDRRFRMLGNPGTGRYAADRKRTGTAYPRRPPA